MKEKQAKGKQLGTHSISAEEMEKAVSSAKKGSVDAFQRLYEFYGRKILNYVYRMTGSLEEAEDLTQDTFVLAYTNLRSLKDNAKFQSWLFRIAQNNIYQKYRGNRPVIDSIQQDELPEVSFEAQGLSARQTSPEDRVLSEELEKFIEKAIGELPDKYREVFILSAVHKLSYKEISKIVGRSLASVKSDIHRARVEVRNRIKQYLGNDYGVSNLF